MNKHDGLRIKSIILCLVLIISGMLVMPTMTGADDGNSGGWFLETPPENLTNDYDPTLLLNEPTNFNISNAGSQIIVFNVTVTDLDDPPNGSYIENVTLSLGVFGGGLTDVDMDYWPMVNDNNTRKTGRWVYNWSTPTTPELTVGEYDLYINASDSGNITDAGSHKRFNIYNFAMTVHQYNRPPTAGTAGSLQFEEDNMTATFDLNGIFNDLDIDTPPKFTIPDKYTFTMWNGTEYVNLQSHDNYTITVDANSGIVGFVPEDNWFNVDDFADPGLTLTFNAKDSKGMHVNNTVEFKILGVNDLPMLKPTGDWTWNTQNVSLSSDKFSGLEDKWWWIQVVATDNDTANPTPDTLLIEVQTTDTTSGLPSKMQVEPDGMFNFTPTNDDVGLWILNVSVTDDIEEDYMLIEFEVGNTNDDPFMTNVWAGNAPSPVTKTPVLNNKASITGAKENEEFNFTVEALDVDVGATLTFAVASGDATPVSAVGAMAHNFAVTPDDDDSAMGYMVVNITVKDGTAVDDWVMVNISVSTVNDPPKITEVAGDTPDVTKSVNMGTIKAGEYDNFTIKAADVDDADDDLTLSSNVTALTFEYAGDGTWNASFHPAAAGSVVANVTVTDKGTLFDYYEFTWTVESAIPPPPPNKSPSITITTESGGKIELGKDIVITGTVSDPDASDNTADGTLEVMVELVMPGETATGDYDTIFSEITYTDGQWTYTYDTSLLEAIADTAKLIGLDMKLEGTYTFYFIAVDDEGAESDPASVTFEVKDSDKDEDAGLLLGLALGLCIVLLIVPLVILILIIVLVLRWRKKKKAEAEAPPEMPPPMPVACTQCGAEIPVGEPNCPACGAPAPAPPAPAPMACTACGAEVLPGSEVCPACGAPAPVPAEGAPVETICECGATIPAGSPTCPVCGRPAPPPMPPEGAEPMTCPACGSGIPPESPTCPACGAAAPAPPEQPPMEEGAAPPEQPLEQMVACPTCGAQIAVGATPCPSCGTALNWG